MKLKQYGLYNIKDHEQLEYFGTINEIAKYLDQSPDSLRSRLTRKKHGARNYIKHKYDIVEMKDEEIEDEPIKADKELWEEILNLFGYIDSTPEEEISKFQIFDAFNWYIKGMVNKVIYDEEWRQIPGFTYSISNWGRVRNDKNGKLKATRNHRWVIQVDIYKDGKRYTVNVPRMEANLFIREVQDNERVTYIDGDRRNNYYKNLKIVSM